MAATQAPSRAPLDREDERHGRDFEALADRLAGAGRDAEAVIAAVHRFEVALPSWAFATGGTRFGRFPGKGEPRTLREKMEDAAITPQEFGMKICQKMRNGLQPSTSAASSSSTGMEAKNCRYIKMWNGCPDSPQRIHGHQVPFRPI
jgi:hypothetical protein